MTDSEPKAPKVFISYCHYDGEESYRERVLELSQKLRSQYRIDCEIDQYYEDDPPAEGWPRWMLKQIKSADAVLVVCTATYQRRFEDTEEEGKGQGAIWEGMIITQTLYDEYARNKRFIPVGFTSYPKNAANIPLPLRNTSYRDVSVSANFEQLLRQITGQRSVHREPLAPRPIFLPPRATPTTGAVADLSAPVIPEKPRVAPVSTSVPEPSMFFTGREGVLQALHTALEQHRAVALSGIGGLGKTQVALRYAATHAEDYESIFFVNADTVETLHAAYADMARRLDLPQKDDKDPDVVAGAVLRWLQNTSGWLLIADNADDLNAVRRLLPFSGKGRLLMTTREHVVGGMADVIRLPVLPDEEGAALLLRRAHLLEPGATLDSVEEGMQADARRLNQTLGGLPLALEQAGSYIEMMQLSPAEYLSQYEQNAKELLTHESYNSNDDHAPVWGTFTLCFAKVEERNPAAANLLRLCSVLAPDPIPEEIFTNGGELVEEALRSSGANGLHELVREVSHFSLLNRDGSSRTLLMHSVVQKVIREDMDSQARCFWAERAVRAIDANLADPEFSQWPTFERLLPHALLCAEHIEKHGFELQEAAHMLHQVGWYLSERGQYSQKEPLVKRALEIREKVLGPEHHDTAKSLGNLAVLYKDTGQYAQAEPLYKRSLEICEKVLGPEHTDTATALNNLARLYQATGRFSQAELLLKRSLEIREKVLGPEHIDTTIALNGLALLYQDTGRLAQAEPLLKRSLEIREKVMGHEHPGIATALNNLAMLYQDTGRHDQAEPLLKRSIKIIEKVLGPEHPDTATALNNLAGLYQYTGRYAQAEPLLKRSLEITEKVLGPEHPDTASYLNNLAMLYQATDRHTQAEPLFNRALAVREKVLGPEHPNTALTISNLAWLYRHTGRIAQAEPLLKKALSIRRKSLGHKHPATRRTCRNYVQLLRDMMRFKQAREEEKRC